MKGLSGIPPIIRFGVFEVDQRAGELRKQGLKIKLQEQPFQVLAMLLERPGEVVTREELHVKVWGSDTFVDLEHGLATAIKKIREALGDDAETPRYVETLPRRGYRFIFPVAAMPSLLVGGGDAAARVGAIHESPLRKRWAVVAVGSALLAVVAVLFALNVAGLRERLLTAVGAVREPTLQIQSIAVLPLENLSGDPEQEYFSDGMTEALITDLGKISALRIISRTSVMRFKGVRPAGGLTEIAQKLNVDAVVEGSVMRSGDRVRITANLIDARSERHLWAEAYDRDLRDVLALQGEVARAIASEIKIRVTPQEQTRLARARPIDPDALQHYLKGRHYWNKFTQDGIETSREHFQRSIEIDPGYAMAYTGLADAFNLLGWLAVLPGKEAYPKAKAAAAKALQIDDSLGEPHASLAFARFHYDWDWPGAKSEFKRAIELNPNYSVARHWHAYCLLSVGQTGEALTEIKRAQKLDPLSHIISNTASAILCWAGRHDQAIEQLQQILEEDPNFAVSHQRLGHEYAEKGMFEESIREYRKAIGLDEGSTYILTGLGKVYAAAGRTAEARKTLRDLEALSKRRWVAPSRVASLCASLGEEDLALEWLEKAYEDRNLGVPNARFDPAFDPLRSDPRFQELLRRMNFPP